MSNKPSFTISVHGNSSAELFSAGLLNIKPEYAIIESAELIQTQHQKNIIPLPAAKAVIICIYGESYEYQTFDRFM